MGITNKIQNIIETHSRGQCLCENALVESDKIFKSLPNFLHCQTSEDGSIEVIFRDDQGDHYCPHDKTIWQAVELLKDQSKSSGVCDE